MKQFTKIRVKRPQSSVFDLSHERKTTVGMGQLIPILCQETLPGDKFRISHEAFLRFLPMLAPIMHRVNVYVHHFFVPNRIIYDDWEKFITGGKDGLAAPNFPKFIGTNASFKNSFPLNGLGDHFGVYSDHLPNDATTADPISQLPFRAYQKIWNDYYRDPTLQAEFEVPTDSVNIDLSLGDSDLLILRRRCWEKDYFTSALPFAQRGAAVDLPLGTVDVTGRPYFEDQTHAPVQGATLATTSPDGLLTTVSDPLKDVSIVSGLTGEVGSTTISDLRRSFALQRWLERNARAGYRYIEQILSHFGVRSSDARLQRPEFLGGGKIPVQISEVLQTSATQEDSAQGNMAGHAFSAGSPAGFSKFFEEHGYVISILSVVPRTAYMDGLPRLFTKFDRYDFAFPEFANIGEQPVYNRELYFSGSPATNAEVFGYQPRYTEYRTVLDSVHGDMRDTLDFWHMARKFGDDLDAPLLNEEFVVCQPTERIFPVLADTNPLILQTYCHFSAIRPLPKYGEPI